MEETTQKTQSTLTGIFVFLGLIQVVLIGQILFGRLSVQMTMLGSGRVFALNVIDSQSAGTTLTNAQMQCLAEEECKIMPNGELKILKPKG